MEVIIIIIIFIVGKEISYRINCSRNHDDLGFGNHDEYKIIPVITSVFRFVREIDYPGLARHKLPYRISYRSIARPNILTDFYPSKKKII